MDDLYAQAQAAVGELAQSEQVHRRACQFLIAVIERAIEEEKVSVQALRHNLAHVRGLLGKHATVTSEEP